MALKTGIIALLLGATSAPAAAATGQDAPAACDQAQYAKDIELLHVITDASFQGLDGDPRAPLPTWGVNPCSQGVGDALYMREGSPELCREKCLFYWVGRGTGPLCVDRAGADWKGRCGVNCNDCQTYVAWRFKRMKEAGKLPCFELERVQSTSIHFNVNMPLFVHQVLVAKPTGGYALANAPHGILLDAWNHAEVKRIHAVRSGFESSFSDEGVTKFTFADCDDGLLPLESADQACLQAQGRPLPAASSERHVGAERAGAVIEKASGAQP
ncbi:MAG: hypothetical protein HY927_08760 [Elusimicrobia bacterium]|nr:hypothetical protein [Elusimicrobiota bacterium]